jgi:hypothetical protein
MQSPFRPSTVVAMGLLAGLALPTGGAAQDHAHHGHGAAQDHHHHHGGPVECTTLAAPPWSGLPDRDRSMILRLEEAVAPFATPAAAAAAGFRPQFGNIPTMGVHWIHAGRMQAGIRAEEPDHLMFAEVNGEERLVGMAYAFVGPVGAEMPEFFESELAAWHDHPELGGRDQTLHMLHVWLVPSPYGPFSGNNFFLPFLGRGVTPPDACWIDGDDAVERLELVGSTFSLVNQLREPEEARGGGAAIFQLRGPAREVLAARAERFDAFGEELDAAARAGDRAAWEATADRMLAELGPVERRAVEAIRAVVKGVQLPGAFRGGL